MFVLFDCNLDGVFGPFETEMEAKRAGFQFLWDTGEFKSNFTFEQFKIEDWEMDVLEVRHKSQMLKNYKPTGKA